MARPVAEPAYPLTIAVCSNRPELVGRFWRHNAACLNGDDALLVVLDAPLTDAAAHLAEHLRGGGIDCVVNGDNLGLAASRNIAIERCRTGHIVFIDDEVTLSRETLDAIRNAFLEGAGIVGVRICGPETLRLPWYMSEAQLHYLAIHTPCTYSTWGACMGFKLSAVRGAQLVFRDELGRRGRDLASGEDTTFVRELRLRGVQERFLAEHHVHHHVDLGRLRFSYLIRRAFWQGRSEWRRRTPREGAKKEWMRNTAAQRSAVGRGLAVLYTAAVVTGVILEALRFKRTRNDSRSTVAGSTQVARSESDS